MNNVKLTDELLEAFRVGGFVEIINKDQKVRGLVSVAVVTESESMEMFSLRTHYCEKMDRLAQDQWSKWMKGGVFSLGMCVDAFNVVSMVNDDLGNPSRLRLECKLLKEVITFFTADEFERNPSQFINAALEEELA